MVTPLSGPADPPFESVVFTNATDSLVMLPRGGGPNLGIPQINAQIIVDSGYLPLFNDFYAQRDANYFGYAISSGSVHSISAGSPFPGASLQFLRSGPAGLRLPLDRWDAYQLSGISSPPHGCYVVLNTQPPFTGLAGQVGTRSTFGIIGPVQMQEFTRLRSYGDLTPPTLATHPALRLTISRFGNSARIIISVTVLQQAVIQKTVGAILNLYRLLKNNADIFYDEWEFVSETGVEFIDSSSQTLTVNPSSLIIQSFQDFVSGSAFIDFACTLGPLAFSIAKNDLPSVFPTPGGTFPATLRLSVPQP